ncbi:MAG: ribonuclease III [Clostridia bacterium]|nr:ribonuclease III [Clostridia bacterium]
MEVQALMQALGHVFRDSGLLCLALTHPSATNRGGKENNQRLEFLGDAVLQLCVSEALFSRYPQKDEGSLTRLRAAIVREESLADAARRISLGEYLRFDHGEAMSGGRDKSSVLADALEAVLAAIYLDAGIDAARKACIRVLGDFSGVRTAHDWKSSLQEKEQADGHDAPVYRVVSEEGPPHARVFYVEAQLQNGARGVGRGLTKKQAEQEAAHAVMEAGTGI